MKRKKKIVIADDNKEICELVVDILASRGYEVNAVYDGYELLGYLENNNPAVIILDLMMPGKDGFAVFNTVRQISPYSRIIIYTGYRDQKDSIYARSADRFLVKGGSMEELIGAVEEFT